MTTGEVRWSRAEQRQPCSEDEQLEIGGRASLERRSFAGDVSLLRTIIAEGV